MTGRLFALLFGGAFGAVGVFMTAMAFNSIWLWWDSSSWQSIPANIESLELDTDHGEDTTYRVLCTYEYKYAGRQYTGDTPSLYSTADNIGSFHARLYERLTAANNAGNVFCLVNPDRPEQSLLDRTFRPGMLAFQMIFMIAFGTIGLVVLAYCFATREPREVDNRMQIDSANRGTRAVARTLILYHGLIAIITVPMALTCLLRGDLYALVPAMLSAVPLAAVYFCWRYLFKQQPVTGTLLLPESIANRDETATLMLPASWQGPVELETRWVIPAPPSNRVGVEDETGDSNHLQLPIVGGTTSVTEIDIPMPDLPQQLPNDQEIKLEVIGTIGGYRYKDDFEIEAKTLKGLQKTAPNPDIIDRP